MTPEEYEQEVHKLMLLTMAAAKEPGLPIEPDHPLNKAQELRDELCRAYKIAYTIAYCCGGHESYEEIDDAE